LLPGSRFSEVDRLLAPMYEAACQLFQRDKNFRFVVATPREAIRERVIEVLSRLRMKSNRLVPPISIVCGEMEHWMQKAIAGIAASGTVTVQSACFNLPLVVIYKVNPITYWLGKLLIKVRYITMINIIVHKIVFEEFVQDEVIPSTLVAALDRILIHGSRREHTLKDMATVIDQLTGPADPSQLAAEEILKEL
jgi:lipid-A-disaccharide synthase